MMKSWPTLGTITIASIGLAAFSLVSSVHAQEPPVKAKPPREVFPDAGQKPLDNWTGPVFQLSQDYPESEPKPEDYRWKKIDFRTDWQGYMKSVLTYCLEGNVENDWVLQKNKVRGWYHAPWMHWGRNGREFIHGLTYERVSLPGELAQTQTSTNQNWAVGMYNAPGGYVIGKVWQDPDKPDASAAHFRDGTVSIKLLFTQATVDQVPYLQGDKEWQAYIYTSVNQPTNPQAPRAVQTLRLLQVDISVRDTRADATTGWLFGTFTYNGNLPGKTPYDRLAPVGLMWGNDPGVTVAMIRDGTKLREKKINSSPDVPFQHLGWGGRLNGPVDNPISSCLSCHSTAQWPVSAPIVPPRSALPDSAQWMTWFRNVKNDEPFTMGSQSLGYSLQLGTGIQNFFQWKAQTLSKGGAFNAPSTARDALRLRESEILPQGNFPISRSGEQ
jgi:hypothetical protein